MNRKEFNTWWLDFKSRFPSKSTWATGNGAQTIDTWREILEPIALVDSIAANKALQNADAEWPNDWERIPKTIHDIANRQRDKRVALEYQRDNGLIDETEANPGFCALCQNTGLVLKEDRKGRWNAWACCCSAGAPQMRIRKNKHTGKEWQLVRFTRPPQSPNPRRFEELDSFNDEIGF